jgi:hypothetical protein
VIRRDFALDVAQKQPLGEIALARSKSMKKVLELLHTLKFRSTAIKASLADGDPDATSKPIPTGKPISNYNNELKLADGTTLGNYYETFTRFCDIFFLNILQSIIDSKTQREAFYDTKKCVAPLYVLKFISMNELDL